MGAQKVEQVDLSTLTDRSQVTMISHTEGGEERRISVFVYSMLGGCAYGAVLSTEQLAGGSGEVGIDRWTSIRTARLPLRGTLVAGGEVTLDLADIFPQGWPNNETLRDAQWEQVPVPCETLELVQGDE